jgi:hypothetical protein
VKCQFPGRCSLISTFWPFPGLFVPAMTSASNNEYRQPRFRVPLSKCDAMYICSKVILGLNVGVPYSGTKNQIDEDMYFASSRCRLI